MKQKWAIIGCGRISYKHIEAMIKNSDTIELVALCDLVEERAIDRKEQYEASIKSDVKVYTDYEKMFAENDIDVVTISSESGYHAKHALDSLNHGCHVLIEKPMAMTLEEVDAINTLADEKGLKVSVSHQNRFNKPIQKLRKAIESNRFGKISNITARILWTRDQNYYAQAPWRGTKAQDGGTLMNQCIHNIDLLQWMVGSEVERVSAERGTFQRDIEMEDFGAILIRFKNGTIGIIEGSAIVYPKNLEETLSVFGETGTAVIGGIAVNKIQTWDFADVQDYDTEDHSTEVDSVYGEGHTPLYADLVDSIVNDRKPYIDGHDGRKAIEIILKAYEYELQS